MLADLHRQGGHETKTKDRLPRHPFACLLQFPKVCKLWMWETDQPSFQTSRQMDVAFSSSPHTHTLALTWSYPCMQKLMESR
jgi:hypothetical protein